MSILITSALGVVSIMRQWDVRWMVSEKIDISKSMYKSLENIYNSKNAITPELRAEIGECFACKRGRGRDELLSVCTKHIVDVIKQLGLVGVDDGTDIHI